MIKSCSFMMRVYKLISQRIPCFTLMALVFKESLSVKDIKVLYLDFILLLIKSEFSDVKSVHFHTHVQFHCVFEELNVTGSLYKLIMPSIHLIILTSTLFLITLPIKHAFA